jgi:RNA polymerase sigma-70 factor (ECF subfamily)
MLGPLADTEPLLAAARAGDRGALEELLARHLAALRAFVRLRVDARVRARESCSDLVQSACREALGGLPRFEYRGEGSFRAWLFTTALNKVREHAEYHAAAKRDPGREEAFASHGDGGGVPSTPSQHAIAAELAERLERAFDALSETEREVLSLSRVAGLTHEQIAERTGRSSGAVRTALSRALARLGRLLDDAAQEDSGSPPRPSR